MQEIPSQLDKRLQNIEATQQVIVELLLKPEHDSQKVEKRYLTAEEAATYLNMALGTLYNHTSSQSIKFYRFSRKLYFLKDDLDQFVNAKPKSQHP